MKILLIGYGSIGKRHARVLKETYPECRIDLVSKQTIAGYEVFSDIASANDLSSYDYFVICSETQLHYEQLVWINSRVSGKTILVEKALFHEWRTVEPVNNRIYVGYNMRYEPALQYLRNKTRGKRILFAGAYVGQFLPQWHPWEDYRTSYSALRTKGGGVLLDLSHELDYLQWLTGVFVDLSAFNSHISNLEIETDDIVSGIATTDNGTIVNFTMDYISKVLKRHLLLHTEDDTYFCDFIDNQIIKGDKSGHQSEIRFENIPHDDTFREMHRSILEQGGGDACTLQEGMNIMELCQRIRKSHGKDADHV